MNLHLTGRAHVEHINLRKEGAQEERELAVDIKLSSTQSADVLAYFHSTLRALLFTDTDSPRIPNLKPVSLAGEIRNLDLTLGGLDVCAVEAKKFIFEPIEGGRVLMTWSVSWFPIREHLPLISELLDTKVPFVLLSQNELPLEPPAPPKPEPAASWPWPGNPEDRPVQAAAPETPPPTTPKKRRAKP